MNQEDYYTLAITLTFISAVLITTLIYAVKIIAEKRKEVLQDTDLFI